jgi:hypothetical protein
MPVISENVPPYSIRPPMTSGDKGIATSCLFKDVERVFNFIQDERHLVAHDLYLSVASRIKDFHEKQRDDDKAKKQKNRGLFRPKAEQEAHHKKEEDARKAKELLESNKQAIDTLEVSKKCCFCVRRVTRLT